MIRDENATLELKKLMDTLSSLSSSGLTNERIEDLIAEGVEKAGGLVRKGADPNAMGDKCGQSLLHILSAGDRKYDDVITELVTVYKANVNLKDKNDHTPLQCLLNNLQQCFIKQVEKIEQIEQTAMTLIGLNANINVRNNNQDTFFHMLLKNNGINHKNMILQLLETCKDRIDLNQADGNYGLTPLEFMKKHRFYKEKNRLPTLNDMEIVINLLRASSAPKENIENFGGKKESLLHMLMTMASEKTNEKTYKSKRVNENNSIEWGIEELVKTDNIDINIKNAEGLTPLQCLMNTFSFSGWNKECDVFLMSSKEIDTFAISNKTNLYLYKDQDHQIFYYINIKGNNKRQDLTDDSVKERLMNQNFNESAVNPVKYTNKEICKSILNFTFNRCHTRNHRIEYYANEYNLKLLSIVMKLVDLGADFTVLNDQGDSLEYILVDILGLGDSHDDQLIYQTIKQLQCYRNKIPNALNNFQHTDGTMLLQYLVNKIRYNIWEQCYCNMTYVAAAISLMSFGADPYIKAYRNGEEGQSFIHLLLSLRDGLKGGDNCLIYNPYLDWYIRVLNEHAIKKEISPLQYLLNEVVLPECDYIYITVILKLVSLGADPHTKNSEGKSLMDLFRQANEEIDYTDEIQELEGYIEQYSVKQCTQEASWNDSVSQLIKYSSLFPKQAKEEERGGEENNLKTQTSSI